MNRLDELFAGLPARMRIHEVAVLLNMTDQGVQKWVTAGVIPAYKVGRSWIILRDELRDTLAAGSNHPLSGYAPDTDSETGDQDTDG